RPRPFMADDGAAYPTRDGGRALAVLSRGRLETDFLPRLRRFACGGDSRLSVGAMRRRGSDANLDRQLVRAPAHAQEREGARLLGRQHPVGRRRRRTVDGVETNDDVVDGQAGPVGRRAWRHTDDARAIARRRELETEQGLLVAWWTRRSGALGAAVVEDGPR